MPDTTEPNSDRSLKWYASREPVILLVLSTLAVICFAAVSGLSRAFHARQETSGQKLFLRAAQDQKAGNSERAVKEYRAALLYSRDNFAYQLGLAEALSSLDGPDKAYPYLLSLREQQPDNGTVNLDLARSLARRGEADEAIRYYQHAIYSTWADGSQDQRREARLELVEFLLKQNSKAQAQAELMTSAANLPAESPLHLRYATLFLQIPDYEHALSQYQQALRVDRHNPEALAGAGQAAFELAKYPLARDYLHDAVEANPKDSASADLLKTASLAIEMDPFRRRISVRRRNSIVADAVATAGERLKSCPPAGEAKTSFPGISGSLNSRWQEMKSQATPGELQRNPDLVDEAMSLVFAIEQRTSSECGQPEGKDLALLLVSKLHEGMEK